MHKLVTFVQLVLYWYNGFSQSVVMESDLFLRISVWESGDTCHNIVRRQIASTEKKGTYGYLLWYHNNKPFLRMPDCHPQISIWLKQEKISTLPEHGHTYTHTRAQKQTHFKTPFCLAVVFVSLRPKPPIVELTTERGVGGWSHSARATLAQKKATTQTNSWQGMERQYFSKN